MRKSRLGLIVNVQAEEKPKKEKEKAEYKDLVQTRELNVAEGIKLVFSVSKTSDGNPHLDIRTYIDTERYSGPTKKGINFDIENLEEFKEILDEIDSDLQAIGE